MPSTPESSLSKDIATLGVIAGGGDIPARLLEACDRRGQDVFLVGFEGQTDLTLLQGRAHMLTRLGAAGQIISTLHTHGVKDLVMIGSIRRPSLAELKPDIRTAKFLARIGLRALGDDGLLKALRRELEGEGFAIHGVQEFIRDLIPSSGNLGRYKPKKDDESCIQRGIDASQTLGSLDIGQAVVVQDGIILAVEGIEGTDELIRRSVAYKRGGRGPLLIKTCKPGQDHDLDLPTIGPETIRLCAKNGFAGVIVHAGHSLLLGRKEIVKIADANKLFVAAYELYDGF